MRARYYGKKIRRWVYKNFKNRTSMMRAKKGLAKRGINLQPLPRRHKIRFARKWR